MTQNNRLSGHGACNGMDPGFFFPESKQESLAAQAVCDSCPVRKLCLEEALDTEALGVWGGTSERERRDILKRRRALPLLQVSTSLP